MEEQLRREKRKERRTGNGRKENRWRQKPTDRGSDSEPKHSQAEKDSWAASRASGRGRFRLAFGEQVAPSCALRLFFILFPAFGSMNISLTAAVAGSKRDASEEREDIPRETKGRASAPPRRAAQPGGEPSLPSRAFAAILLFVISCAGFH